MTETKHRRYLHQLLRGMVGVEDNSTKGHEAASTKAAAAPAQCMQHVQELFSLLRLISFEGETAAIHGMGGFGGMLTYVDVC